MSKPLNPKQRILAIGFAAASLTISAFLLAAWDCAHSAGPGSCAQVPWQTMYNNFKHLLGGLNWAATFSCAAGAYGFRNRRWQALLACCFAIGLTVGMMIALEPQTARE
jgi:hypothetical protein